jgi:hypothetical protein
VSQALSACIAADDRQDLAGDVTGATGGGEEYESGCNFSVSLGVDVPDDVAGVYRAAALALIGKPVDAALLREAAERRSNDDPVYSHDIRTA